MLNCPQDLNENSVALMNTNFFIISKTAWALCHCGADTEWTSHFFLHCQFVVNDGQKLHDDVYWLDASIKHLNEESLIDVLLYGSDRFSDSKNKQILLHTICYI